MILLIDNYDSFTYNLVQRLGEIDPSLDLEVYRNDQIGLDEIEAKRPTHLIISPGPCTPNEAGISVSCVKQFAGRVPLLGVCLGHQAIGEAYGGRVVRAPSLMHGKLSQVRHDGSGLFAGVPDPFTATRYHSLVVEPATLPASLEVTARTDDGVIMALRHREQPVVGVQFHPESIGTAAGYRILENFLEMTAAPLQLQVRR